jgi:hypothetical protein
MVPFEASRRSRYTVLSANRSEIKLNKHVKRININLKGCIIVFSLWLTRSREKEIFFLHDYKFALPYLKFWG